MIRNEHIKACKKRIKTENLLTILNPRGENHTNIYIFEHSYIEAVINFTLLLSPPCFFKCIIPKNYYKNFKYSQMRPEELREYFEILINWYKKWF